MQDLANKKDEELIFLSRKGEKSATECLLSRYAGLVRSLTRRFFLLGGEQEDLAQEGMVGLYLAIDGFDANSGKTFKNFAYLCVRRRIIDAIKSAQGRNKMPLNGYVSIYDPNLMLFSEEDSPEDLLIGSENDREFWVKVSKALSDFEFRVLSMYLNGLTYHEICEATGKDVKSIDNALARSKKKLQRVYGA